MDNGRVIGSFLIAAGLIGAAWIAGSELSEGIRGFKDADRVVVVKGLAEKEVKADHVIWPLSFREMGNDLVGVYDQLEGKQSLVLKYLKEGGIEESEISIAAPKVKDVLADSYDPNRMPYRYIITQVITVSSNKIDVVRKLVEEQRNLIKAGVALNNSYEYNTNYSYTKLNEIKPGMIEAATKNAKEAANKFAEDSGSKLGKIKRANQGIFSISDRDENTPYIKKIRVVTTVDYYLKD